jgi:hypothetical protein
MRRLRIVFQRGDEKHWVGRLLDDNNSQIDILESDIDDLIKQLNWLKKKISENL